MAYTFTQDLITEPQTVAEGICLADWEGVPGFDWTDLEKSSQLIMPKAVAARAAGLLRTIIIARPGDSPNSGGFGQLVPSPCPGVVLHWWGNPIGQQHDGIVAWLKAPVSQVSAHYVISPGRVTQILPLTSPSWANGNSYANATFITIEADPNDVPGTIATVVELLDQLVADGALTGDYRLSGHRDWYATTCPGTYYSRLPEIRAAAEGTTTTNQGGLTMTDITDIIARLDKLIDMQGGHDTINTNLLKVARQVDVIDSKQGGHDVINRNLLNGLAEVLAAVRAVPGIDPDAVARIEQAAAKLEAAAADPGSIADKLRIVAVEEA